VLAVSTAPALVARSDTVLIADALVAGTDWHAFVAVFDGTSTVVRMDALAEEAGTTGNAAPACMEGGATSSRRRSFKPRSRSGLATERSRQRNALTS
jgi:hypothetical protein